MPFDKDRFMNNLLYQAAENPLAAMAIVGGVIGAVGKIIDASGHAVGSRAYSRQVKHRMKQDRRAKKHPRYARY